MLDRERKKEAFKYILAKFIFLRTLIVIVLPTEDECCDPLRFPQFSKR